MALAATAGGGDRERPALRVGPHPRRVAAGVGARSPAQLLSADRDAVDRRCELVAERSRGLADADLVTVVLPAGATASPVCASRSRSGPAPSELPGRRLPDGRIAVRPGLLAPATPLRPVDRRRAATASRGAGRWSSGPVLAVPLHRLATRCTACSGPARRPGRPAFTADEVDMAAGFANQAALAIELAEARAEQQRAAMLDERERIAADLHDHVIQRLFAAGLSLQSVGAAPAGAGRGDRPDPGHDRRPRRHDPADPDQIFQLQHDPDGPGAAGCGRGCSTWLADVDSGARLRARRCGSSGVLDDRSPTTSARTSLAVAARVPDQRRPARAGARRARWTSPRPPSG